MATLNAIRADAKVAADMAEPWRALAACHGRSAVMDPPAGLDGADRRKARLLARAVCLDCPVIADCTTWVLGLDEMDDPGGMCAGMTELQRKSRRRADAKSRRRTRCEQVAS